MKSFLKSSLTFSSNIFFGSHRPLPSLPLEKLTTIVAWLGRGMQILLAGGMFGLMLVPQVRWALPGLESPEVQGHALLLMMTYPLIHMILDRLIESSLDIKIVMLQCTGALVHFFVLMGLGIWCQSWSLEKVIQHQEDLMFGFQFFPLLILECVRYVITPTSFTGPGWWRQGQGICHVGLFLVAINALFWGGRGIGSSLEGGIVLKILLMYGAIAWSSMSLVRLSPDQTTRALLKYLLPLSFSFFIVFLLARTVITWLAL